MLKAQAAPSNAVSVAAAHLVHAVEGDSERTQLALTAILATTARLYAVLGRLERDSRAADRGAIRLVRLPTRTSAAVVRE